MGSTSSHTSSGIRRRRLRPARETAIMRYAKAMLTGTPLTVTGTNLRIGRRVRQLSQGRLRVNTDGHAPPGAHQAHPGRGQLEGRVEIAPASRENKPA